MKKQLIRAGIGREFPETLTLEDWVHEGVDIYRQAENLTWHLADWAAFGERTFGTLKEFCEKHGMNYGMARTYAYVASNVPMSVRTDRLSFTHHATVAALPQRDQITWLDKASKHNWTVAELRRQLRSAETPADTGPKFRFEDKFALDLHHALTSKPEGYWTSQTKTEWRKKLKPIVDFYNNTLSPLAAGSFQGKNSIR